MAKLPTSSVASTEASAENTVTDQIDGTAPVDQTAETATEKKLSPKHKDSRGVPKDWKTTWVPLDLTAEEHERLTHIASVLDDRREKLDPPQKRLGLAGQMQAVLKYGIEAYKQQFDEALASYVPKSPSGKAAKKLEDMTPEEALKASMSAEQRAVANLAKAREQMAAAKARAEALKAQTA